MTSKVISIQSVVKDSLFIYLWYIRVGNVNGPFSDLECLEEFNYRSISIIVPRADIEDGESGDIVRQKG